MDPQHVPLRGRPIGKPKQALAVDVGEGAIIRYDEEAQEIVGLTPIGVGNRMEE